MSSIESYNSAVNKIKMLYGSKLQTIDRNAFIADTELIVVTNEGDISKTTTFCKHHKVWGNWIISENQQWNDIEFRNKRYSVSYSVRHIQKYYFVHKYIIAQWFGDLLLLGKIGERQRIKIKNFRDLKYTNGKIIVETGTETREYKLVEGRLVRKWEKLKN